MILILILGFVLGAGVILFILQNTAVVALSFLGWQFESSIAVIVLLSLLIGVILTALMTLPGAIGSSFAMRRLRKHNEALTREAEVHKQAADDASSRLVAAQTPQPDVIDLQQ
jgi:uncharacterized integral membrane protein